MVLDDIFADMRRCTTCILPETFPGIRFDVNGTCNYCNSYRKVQPKGERALRGVLSKYRNNGPKYDCIVPISGGRDSAFVLHQMVNKYDMHPLALTVDSGAITVEGYRNIRQATRALDVDHVWIKDENQIKTAKRNTRLRFHAWLGKPSINTIVPVLNASDKTMNLRIYKHASNNGISLVIGGNNVGNSSFEQEHFKTGYLGVFPDESGKYTTYDRVKLSVLLTLEFLKNRKYYHWSIFKEYFEGAFIYFFESILKPKSIEPLSFYDYVYWNEKDVTSTITRKLNWKGATDTTATWRIDDAAYPLIDYIYLRLVGFNEFDEHYSKMIREGQIEREEALKRCLSDRAPRMHAVMESLKELGTTKDLVDQVLENYRVKFLAEVSKRKHRQLKN